MIRLSIEAETLDLFLRDAVELSACLNEAFARMPVAETPKKPESPQEAHIKIGKDAVLSIIRNIKQL